MTQASFAGQGQNSGRNGRGSGNGRGQGPGRGMGYTLKPKTSKVAREQHIRLWHIKCRRSYAHYTREDQAVRWH
jgi:hypothetical protein